MGIRQGAFLLVVAACCAVTAALASDSTPTFSKNRYGSIVGRVFDHRGIAQKGVPVLVSRDDGRFAQTVYTETSGRFRLSRLLPGAYAIEVVLPNFLPFRRGPVRVESGAEVLLQVNLLALADSLELRLPEDPDQAREEWKWVLRTGTPARPILRFQPQPATGTNPLSDPRERALRGTLQLLAGNESRGFARDPGLRTSFQVEYPWSGVSTLSFAGSVGWEQNTPATSFRASWDRQMPDGAESSLSATVRQLFLPAEYWDQVSISDGPSQGRMQSFTLGYESEMNLGDRFRLQYGTLFDALSLGEAMLRWSPFGRLTYLYSDGTRFTVAYVGAAPRILPTEKNGGWQNLEQWLAIPQISSDNRLQPVLEEGRHVEATLEWEGGAIWHFEGAAFYDSLSNAALSLAVLSPSPILAGTLRDPFSNRYFLSGGNYASPGLRAAVGTHWGGNSELIVGYGYAGGLRSRAPELFVESIDALRALVRAERGHSLSVKFISKVPRTRTRVTASYKWIPSQSVVAPDPYDRGLGSADPYLQLVLLQPLPSPDIFHGQFQAVASITNILAQGYLTVHTPDGTSYLFPVARSFRGGFSFIF
ncbi:MAG: carboxypeptidase regulatory-like domain-containing protein [Acidobacteria bacterium]|nr:carboxypeptidase regulatory-like domain-containing protein [Acidobacteriota bacterium]